MEAQRIADHQSILLNLRYPTLRAPNRTTTAMIRTLTFALRRDPDTSRAIGHHATQQNLAYNHAVDVLNREPNLPKRSGENHPDALNKRITAWRQANRQQADAPYYIHQEGGEQAWEANQRMQQGRTERLERIARAIANGEEPKHRDIRPHRRTLTHRTRKHRRLSLTITDRRLFQVSDDSQTLSSRQCGFTVRLRGRQTLKWLDIRSIRLVPVKNYGPRTPLQRRHYCLHVQVSVPEPMLLEELDIQSVEDIVGADRGAKNHLAVSSGHRAHHQGGGRRRNQKRKHQRHIAGKPRDSKRRRHAVSKSHDRGRRYAQTRDQDLRSQIRVILLEAQPKMVAIESLHPISMMASARGTIAAPGKNVAAKRKLNESLAESAIGHVGKLLREEAAKLGIPTVSVPPHGTSQTCPRCGDRHPDNRESQAVFRCRNCDLYALADWTAAVIIRNRAYVRHCEWQSGHTPDVLTAPTGWREQPSSSEPSQPRLGLELSVFKPEGTATSSYRNRVRGPRPARRIQAAGQGAKSVTNSISHGIHSRGYSELSVENPVSGFHAQFVNTL
jgi:transposase